MRFAFLKTIFIVAAILAVFAGIPIAIWGSHELIKASIASGLIALGNVVVGCYLLEYAIDKSNQVFLISVFGGMFARMLVILVLFAILQRSGYDATTLALSLMGFYVAFLIAEIVYVLRELNKRNANARKKKFQPRKPITSVRQGAQSDGRTIEQKTY